MDVGDLRRAEAGTSGTPQAEPAEVHEGPRFPDPRLEMKDPSGVDAAGAAQAAASRFRATPRWPLTLGRLPSRAPAFRSRDALREHITNARESGSVVILAPGPQLSGGVGCTQLAVSLAEDAVAAGTDLVLWVDLGAPGALVEAFARAAADVQAPGVSGRPVDAEADARAFLVWAAATDRAWLVVLDGLVDPAEVEGWWPSSEAGTGWTLVTARVRHLDLAAHGRVLVDVEAFTADEAEAYLTERLTEAGAPELAQLGTEQLPEAAEPGEEGAARTGVADLAETLERLPLALAQAAAYLLAERVPCSVYRDRYLQAVARLRDLRPVTDRQERIVAVTSLLALDAAEPRPPVGLARPALALAAVLDPVGHPSSLWATDPVTCYLTEHRVAGTSGNEHEAGRRGWARIRPGRTASAGAGRAGPVDEQQSLAVLDLLARYGLLERDEAAGAHAVRMGTLTARAVRNTAAAGSMAPIAVVAADALLAVWPDLHHDRPGLVADLRANVRSVSAAAGRLLWTDEDRKSVV